MVGSAIYRLLVRSKEFKIISCKRSDLDFTNKIRVEKWFKTKKPEIVINCAGKVGGILHQNMVKKLLFLGSACIYPKKTRQPIKEEYLLSSNLESTNEGYALAKISVLKYCEYLNKKYKKDYVSLQPANLYGEGDNFDLKSSHVIPALIKKFHYAKIKNKKQVEVWGSGNVKREFLNVEDLASAIKFCLDKKIKYEFLNIGSGEQISIKKLALMIKQITRYNGKIVFNKTYPDGVKMRKLDTKKINSIGWTPKIFLKEGLTKYYHYFTKIAAMKNYKF